MVEGVQQGPVLVETFFEVERTPRKTDYLEDHPTRPADVQPRWE